VDETSQLVGRPMWSVDMDPDRSAAVIGAAGVSSSPGAAHVEVVLTRPGEEWVPDELERLGRRHGGKRQVVIDNSGPAATLIKPLEKRGWTVHALPVPGVALACGYIHDQVRDRGVVHIGQTELDVAVAGAGFSKLGDRWRFNRGASVVNIASLMAVVLALYGHSLYPARTGSILDTVG
jgi:hypothetical protein